jgi:nitrogen fixation/metabolism regulation signal transduction histidine kinase
LLTRYRRETGDRPLDKARDRGRRRRRRKLVEAADCAQRSIGERSGRHSSEPVSNAGRFRIRFRHHPVPIKTEPGPSMPQDQPRFRISHDRRLFFIALLAGLPGVVVSLILLWTGDFTPRLQWTLTIVIVTAWLVLVSETRQRVIFSLQTLSSILAALREGDYSIRGRDSRHKDALAELTREVNTLAQTLREQRMDALEATTLLRKVMEEIDVAVFSFDGEQKLRLVNRAGERLLNMPSERLLGLKAQDIGLAECLNQGAGPRVIDAAFPGESGRWEIRRSMFRQGGLRHQLLVLSNVSRALREEELKAWQRIVRVIGHELNNSLAPIKSISGSLTSLLQKQTRPPDWEEDMLRGLAVIASRSESLGRFMAAYARLAKLPPPRFQPVDIGALLRRIVGLETRLAVTLEAGPELTIQADGDQLEQLLINIVRNAVDASLETSGGVHVCWQQSGSCLDIIIRDDGPGLPNAANLFVPFFTTKPGGSGIGLVLSRQIAEAHGGTLVLENRADRRGCEARLRLRV